MKGKKSVLVGKVSQSRRGGRKAKNNKQKGDQNPSPKSHE
jgi:hypothetical protein